MGYRNKTYIIFDGDKDMWAYSYMKGWNEKEHIDFNFHDAHELNKLLSTSTEETVKRKLRERLVNTKQAIVLIGESTKNLYRFVRWELETCLSLGLPIVAVNLNNERQKDDNLCPPLINNKPVVHVAFRMKIIKHALDDFCENFSQHKDKANLYYPNSVYQSLGL